MAMNSWFTMIYQWIQHIQHDHPTISAVSGPQLNSELKTCSCSPVESHGLSLGSRGWGSESIRTITHDGSMVLAYMLTFGVYWWDPWHTINIASPWIRHGYWEPRAWLARHRHYGIKPQYLCLFQLSILNTLDDQLNGLSLHSEIAWSVVSWLKPKLCKAVFWEGWEIRNLHGGRPR